MAILKKIQGQKNNTKKTFRTPFSFDVAPVPEENIEPKEKVQTRQKKKRNGRPKINKEDRRTKSVSVVITEIESKKLCKLVKKSRLSKSEYIRRLIQQAIEKNIYHL